ncbi:hypothetical protein [Fibrobacter sp.]|uniref:hypothetical protein n=1 Tax=Fibrobacter sp. TaxID=35828 RepID=UPI00386E6BF5
MSVEDFYVKYILKSKNWYFTECCHLEGVELIDKIDLFREIVSNSFNVSFYSVKMVGSAKVGFSLSPKKDFKSFGAGDMLGNYSDIDIAIVSDQLYNDYWQNFRDSCNQNYNFPSPRLFERVSSSIYKGFINDKDIREIPEMRKKWDEKADAATANLQRRLLITHPITYRLYRNWNDLQEYQLNGIRALKNKGENNVPSR